MSLFGGFMGDDDMFNPMAAMNMQMRSMNRLMNSLMPDPFNMLGSFDSGFQQNALMDYNQRQAGGGAQIGMGLFGFPGMPNMNRLISADIGSPNGASYCSSSVITMSSGPDGRPQVYQATTSTKTGPGGIRETRKTVQDSTRGIKKMAIGHHIGERAHIIEKEQDLNSGQLEERQEFVNLEEEQAEDFDREFTTRAQTSGFRGGQRHARPMLTIEPLDDEDDDVIIEEPHRQLPALPAPSHQTQQPQNSSAKSSNDKVATSTTTTANTPTIDLTSTDDTIDNENTTTSNVSTTPAQSAQTYIHNSQHHSNNNNNNSPNYLGGPTRRIFHHRAHHLSNIAPRRPLPRTPPSSPLALTLPMHYMNSAATSLSVHPHPYNSSAARRKFRSKHTKHHQQQTQQQQQPANGSVTTEAVKSTSPKHNKK